MSLTIRRAAAAGNLVWWSNAVLAGTAAADNALTHMAGQVLLPSAVAANNTQAHLAGPATQRASWPLVWGWLRKHDSDHLRLVLPVPGDPVGITADKDVAAAAINAAVAIVMPAAGQLLLPIADGLWQAKPIRDGLPGGGLGTLSEARREMREAMAHVTATISSINPDEQTLEDLARLRREDIAPQPPPGVDPRAAQLVQSAGLVWELTRIAMPLGETGATREQLRELNRAARRALAVAFSHPVAVT